jgi:hypothetical protein
MSKTHEKPGAKPTGWPPASVLSPKPDHKWEKKVIFDFHEVCALWLPRFCDFVNRSYGYNIKPEELSFYHMQFDPSCPLTPAEFNEAFVAFARLAKGGYGDLEPVPGIVEAMNQIKAAGIGIEIWTWTPGATEQKFEGGSAYQTGIPQRVTMDLIAKMGLPIDRERDVRFMPPGRKKWEMAEEHIPLIVEDNPETALGCTQGTAHAAILIPYPYNEGFAARNVLRLSNRSELAPTVIDFFKKLEDAGVLL